MIKTYRKTDTIKAERFDGSREMCEKYHIKYDEAYILPFIIETIDGWLGMKAGDWICIGVNGEHWPIADDIFKKTYAELPIITKGVARWIELTKQAGKSLGDMFVDYTPEQLTDADEDMISDWVGDNKNQTILANTLARAWLDGYRVEEANEKN